MYFLKVEKLRRWDDEDSERWYAEIFDGAHVPTKVLKYHAKLRPSRGIVRCRACHDKHVAMFSAMRDFVPAKKPARNKTACLKPNPKRPPSTDSDGMSFSPWKDHWGPVRTPSEQSPLPFDPNARGALPVPAVKPELSRTPSRKRSRFHYHRKGS